MKWSNYYGIHLQHRAERESQKEQIGWYYTWRNRILSFSLLPSVCEYQEFRRRIIISLDEDPAWEKRLIFYRRPAKVDVMKEISHVFSQQRHWAKEIVIGPRQIKYVYTNWETRRADFVFKSAL